MKLTSLNGGHLDLRPQGYQLDFVHDEDHEDEWLVIAAVHLSHESMPPWHPHHEWPDYQSFAITLVFGKADIQGAAARWRTEIAAFPDRYNGVR